MPMRNASPGKAGTPRNSVKILSKKTPVKQMDSDTESIKNKKQFKNKQSPLKNLSLLSNNSQQRKKSMGVN